MATKANDNTECDHDFEPSLYESGREVCAWGCGASREAPIAPREGIDLPRGFVAAERRAA